MESADDLAYTVGFIHSNPEMAEGLSLVQILNQVLQVLTAEELQSIISSIDPDDSLDTLLRFIQEISICCEKHFNQSLLFWYVISNHFITPQICGGMKCYFKKMCGSENCRLQNLPSDWQLLADWNMAVLPPLSG